MSVFIKLYWNRVIFWVIFTRAMSVLQRLNRVAGSWPLLPVALAGHIHVKKGWFEGSRAACPGVVEHALFGPQGR